MLVHNGAGPSDACQRSSKQGSIQVSTNLMTRYAALPLFVIVVLTVVSCAGPAADDPDSGVPLTSSVSVPDSEFPAPLPEPTDPPPGSSPSPGGNANPGDNAHPGGNANPGANTNPGGGPPLESTEPLPGGNTNPGGSTVNVAGPTPDNLYQRAGVWAAFTSSDDTNSGDVKCTSIANKSQLDVRITRVRFTGQEPSSPPVFGFLSSAECNEGLGTVGPCLDGPVLSPYNQDSGPTCHIGMATTAQPGVDYTVELVYDLETDCTTTTVSPCNDEKVRARAPSPSAPVRVTWQYIEPIVACFAERPDSPVTPLDPDNPDSGPKYPHYPYYDEEFLDPPRCPPRSSV